MQVRWEPRDPNASASPVRRQASIAVFGTRRPAATTTLPLRKKASSATGRTSSASHQTKLAFVPAPVKAGALDPAADVPRRIVFGGRVPDDAPIAPAPSTGTVKAAATSRAALPRAYAQTILARIPAKGVTVDDDDSEEMEYEVADVEPSQRSPSPVPRANKPAKKASPANDTAAAAKTKSILQQAARQVLEEQKNDCKDAKSAASKLGYRVFTRYLHTPEQLQALADEVSLEYMPPWALKDVPRPKKERKPWRDGPPTQEELEGLEKLIQGTEEWFKARKGQLGCSEIGNLLGLLDTTRRILFKIMMGLKRSKELDKDDTYFMVRGHYREDEARRVWAHVVRPKGGKIEERGIIIDPEHYLIHCRYVQLPCLAFRRLKLLCTDQSLALSLVSGSSPDGIYEASDAVHHAWMLDDCGKPVLVEIKAPVSAPYRMSESPAYKKALNAAIAAIDRIKEQAENKIQYLQDEDEKVAERAKAAAGAASQVTLPTPRIDRTKGDHFGVPVQYALQTAGQMGSTKAKLKAKVCDFVPHWRFDDMFDPHEPHSFNNPRYHKESGRFLISHTQGSRIWHSDEFFSVLYEEVKRFCHACKAEQLPEEFADKADILGKFPPVRMAPIAEVRVWLSPRKDAQGAYIYGGKDKHGTPLPETEMGEYEGRPYKKRIIGTRRCFVVDVPANSVPREVTLKELAQECYDPVPTPAAAAAATPTSPPRKRKLKA
jgi:hypothetical protein